MKKIIFILLLFASYVSAQDIGADRYVAHPDSTYSGMAQGDDNADGSYATPWASWYKALSSAQSGQKICIRDGRYYQTWTDWNDATLANDSVKLFGYPGEQPIIDGDSLGDYLIPNASNDVYNYGLRINTHAHDSIINIDFVNFKQYDQVVGEDTINWLPVGGIVGAQNCVHMYYEDVNIYDGMIKGFVQYSGYWNSYDSAYAVSLGYSPEDATPPFDSIMGDTTMWVDCDVHDLADLWSYDVVTGAYEGGNHADAWKGGNYQNSQYTWTRCRAWNYTDDGIDFNLPGYKIFNDVWMMAGGYYDTLEQYEGNGIKLTAHARNDYYFPQYLSDTILTKYNNCVTAFCSFGFLNDFFIDVPEDQDKTSANGRFYNCIGYGNTRNLDAPIAQVDTLLTITLKNTLMFGAAGTNACGDPQDIDMLSTTNAEDALETGSYRNNIEYTGYTVGGCGRWDYDVSTFTVTSADFVNALDSTQIVADFTADRNEDGSYSVALFETTEGSDLRDAGVDVGLPYSGTAPDVGIYQSGGSAPSSTIRPIMSGDRLYMIGNRIFK